ncbi:MAG: T9SS type A sorting domain-containing protein, partial [Saprospiraceae bacterium]
TVITFDCQLCVTVSNPIIECKPNGGGYDYTVDITNNSSHTVTKISLIMISPTNLAQFNPIDFSFLAFLPNTTQTITTCIEPVLGGNPLIPGTQIDYQGVLWDEKFNEFWCCHADTFSVILPPCEEECPMLVNASFNCADTDVDGDGTIDISYVLDFVGTGTIDLWSACPDLNLGTITINNTAQLTGFILSTNWNSNTVGLSLTNFLPNGDWCHEEFNTYQLPTCGLTGGGGGGHGMDFSTLSDNSINTSKTKLDNIDESDEGSSGSIQIPLESINPIQSRVDNKLILYPNPTIDFINVKGSLGASIEIFDINGKLIQSAKMNEVELELDVSNITVGLYFVRMTLSDGTIQTSRFVRQ